jgi:hypothetical protein
MAHGGYVVFLAAFSLMVDKIEKESKVASN